ncbi:MAG: hypothetical protein ACUVXG_06365 [Anaerolineae bacterium]
MTALAHRAKPFLTRRRAWVDLLLIALVAIGFTRGWWREGLPIGDFQGTLGWSWYLGTSLQELGRAPAWSPYWFNGGMFLTVASPLAFFLPLAFAGLVGWVGSLKFLVILSYVLSGWAMYGIASQLLRDRSAALVAGVVFAVHPVHLAEGAFYAHVEIALAYVLIPLLFGCYGQALQQPGRQRWTLTTVGILAVILLLSVEITLLAAVWLAFTFLWWAGWTWRQARREGRTPWKAVGSGLARSAAIALAAAGMVGFRLLPMVQELPRASLVSSEEARSFALTAAADSPVLLMDRAGHFLLQTAPHRVLVEAYGLPEQGAGVYLGLYYLGGVTLALAVLPWLLGRGGGRGPTSFLWCALWGALWVSLGPYSLYAITLNPHSRLWWLWAGHLPLGDKVLLGVVTALILGTAGLGAWRRWRGKPCQPRTLALALALLVALGPLVLWIKPFVLLRTFVPFLSHMRMPLRFFTMVVPALALLAGSGVVALRRVLRPAAFRAAWVVALVLLLVDFWPYARLFDLQWPLADLEETFAPFAADAESYTLGSVYANGVLGDFGMTLARKPIVWGWLEWAAPRGRRGFAHGLGALGWDAREDPEGAKDLANLLALSNARYLIHPWLPDAGFVRTLAATSYFRLHRTGERFAVLENLSPAWYVQLYGDAVLYWDTRSGPDDLSREERLARLVARAAPRGVAVVEAAALEAPQPYRFMAVDPGEKKEVPAEFPHLRLPADGNALRQEVDRRLPEAVPQPARDVHWDRPQPEEIRVQVGAGDPCLLTVAESWHPRWQVYQDGNPLGAPLRVNGGFQGVWLDGQAHELRFRFEPGPAGRWGWGVTVLTLAAGAAWLVWGRR